jgi:hypothetical protein
MSENSEMTCEEMADVAAELALGVLTGRERAMAVAHLDTCDGCREDVRQLMATGEQLIELLPPAEPPAGFETRVLARLGLPAPPQDRAQPATLSRLDHTPRHRRPADGEARPSGERPGSDRPGSDRPGSDRPGSDRPGAQRPGAQRPGGTRRPGRLRRSLAAVAVGLAVVLAGVGGWRIGVGSSPAASTAAGPVTTANLLSTAHQSVGTIFLYSGTPRWLFMSVDMESGDGSVTCQLVDANGKVHTLGTFHLVNGYGQWGSPDPGNVGDVHGARLVSATGAVLATATFAW